MAPSLYNDRLGPESHEERTVHDDLGSFSALLQHPAELVMKHVDGLARSLALENLRDLEAGVQAHELKRPAIIGEGICRLLGGHCRCEDDEVGFLEEALVGPILQEA